MLSLDKLAALDLSVWLRSGQEAADRLAITQPNVNRRVHHCLALLGLNLAKHDDEWEVEGPAFGLELLALERRVHQTARWMGRAPLRVEGTYWSGPLLLNPSPAGWVVGRCNVVGIGRPLQWLREGMIDGWLAGGPDWPEPQDPEFAVIELCHMPVHAVVAPGHPLLHSSSGARSSPGMTWRRFRRWRCRRAPIRRWRPASRSWACGAALPAWPATAAAAGRAKPSSS